MTPTTSIALFLLATFITAVSQIILKVSARSTSRTGLSQYLNPLVLGAYILLFGATGLSVYAYRGIGYKFGAMLGVFAYVWVMLLGCLLLKEPVTMRKVLGNVLIVAGVIVFFWS